MTLNGERIVVLGGSSGIGLATAQAATREGATIVIASSRKDRIDEALATLPAGTEGHVLDLADADATKALFQQLGSFDHLVFTAGETLQLGTLATVDIDAARRFFTLRYWGAYCAAKYGSSSIRKGGSIVFTSGVAGRRPHAGWSLGASICAAMEGLTRALAVELAPIRVNIVSPGVVHAAVGEHDGSRPQGAVSAVGGQAASRPCRRRGGDCASLSLPDAAELQHGSGHHRGWWRGPGLSSRLV
jgi:NAD(P)-dependent dehydrogenase (short-subunit alcohol dehydrogenase family)